MLMITLHENNPPNMTHDIILCERTHLIPPKSTCKKQQTCLIPVRASKVPWFFLYAAQPKSDDPELHKFGTFWQKVVYYGAILKDVSLSETIKWCWTMHQKTNIFQYSKHYGSLKSVTRLNYYFQFVNLTVNHFLLHDAVFKTPNFC